MDDVYAFRMPPEPKWQVSLSPDFYVSAHVPYAPNWIYRQIQRLVLGIHWRRLTSRT